MKAIKYLAFSIALCSAALSFFRIEALEILAPSEEGYLKYTMPNRVSIAAVGGEMYGCEKRWASAGYFCAPTVCSDCIVPFIDLQGHYLDRSHWAANAGVGVRWSNCCDCRVYGFNVYYDYKQGCRGDFNDVGVGLEFLGLNFDIRVNGYMPFGKTLYTHTRTFNSYLGGFVATCKRKEFAMPGLDFEIGRYIGPSCTYMLYGAIGGYYYNKEHYLHFLGVVGRLKIQYNEYLSLEVKASYDDVCKGKLQGILQLTIPFEMFGCVCSTLDCCSRGLFLQPVHRKDVLVTNTCQHWITNF